MEILFSMLCSLRFLVWCLQLTSLMRRKVAAVFMMLEMMNCEWERYSRISFTIIQNPNFRIFQYHGPLIGWFNVVADSETEKFLPVMRSDMVLKGKGSNSVSLIVDMKYYAKLFNTRFSADKLISGHLYQIFTYLSNSQKEDIHRKWHGMLLYPVVCQDVSFDYEMDATPIHIRTINLDQCWSDIEEDINKILLQNFV